MLSRKAKLRLFHQVFQQHYQAKLPRMQFHYLTPQVLQVVRVLKQENLITTFFIFPLTKSITILFRYINNNDLLFRSLRVPTARVQLTSKALVHFLHQKRSLVFPITLLWIPSVGLLSDRQLVYAWVEGRLSRTLGAEIVLQLMP